MLLHHLKIAWRNILKYKTQSVISVVGVAIGFTAFVFTLSWIRYEDGYDKHNPDADRIYRVFLKDTTEIGGVKKYAPKVFATYLKDNYPEIDFATAVYPYQRDWTLKDEILLSNIHYLRADTFFFHVFYPEVKVAYPEVIPPDCKVFSQSSADKLRLKAEQRGQRIDSLKTYLLDIVPDKPMHSNVPFDVIELPQQDEKSDNSWGIYTDYIYIRLKKGVDASLLAEQLEKFSVVQQVAENITHAREYSCKLVPLTQLRSKHPDIEVAIQYRHLRLFAGVSLLVILSAFFNYLMLFINKIKIRHRELVLHKVNGASTFQLLLMLFFEFVILLLIALICGLALTEVLYPHFIKFSMLGASKSFFWREAILFGSMLLILSALFSYIPVRYMLRRTIRESLLPSANSGKVKDRFSRITITLQLIISSILIFSTSLFLHQYNYINSNEIGFDRHNVNTVIAYGNEIPFDEIKKVPGVIEVTRFGGDFLPRGFIRNRSVDVNSASDKSRTVNFNVFSIYGPEYVDFFKMKIMEGRNIFEGEKDACLINKTASLMLNTNYSSEMKEILGQRVVGVVADMYIDSPSIPVYPSIYFIHTPQSYEPQNLFAYRYADGQREATEKELQRLAKEEFEIGNISISNMEEIYAEYSKSERYLLILLSIMTGVAIAIAVFGTYSIITLACQRRRKEIAIRKVNGASVLDILLLFLREYFLITAVACIVAFPIGAFVMQRWLEQYVRRVSMEWWLFVRLFLLMLFLVLASVLFQVVRAAKQNPADVVKSE